VGLYLLRHGSTDANSEDTVRGQIDAPLNAEGKQDAKKQAEKWGKEPVSAIYSSDLSRALDCAKAISASTGVAVRPTRQLRTWGRGPDIEGKPTKSVQALIDSYIARPNIAPRGGESWAAFVHRIIHALQFIESQGPKFGDVLAVTHLTPIIVVKDWVKAGRPADPMKADYRNPDLKSIDTGSDYYVPDS